MAEYDWQKKFLQTLSETGNVSKSAQKAGIVRSRAYQAKEESKDFADAWNQALEIAADALEEEARRRAAVGVLEPVFYQGEKVGTVRKYSDTLLIFLLKGIRPEKYRERSDVTSGGEKLPTPIIYVPNNGRDKAND